MFSNNQIARLTDDIYDAGLDAGQWTRVLGRLAEDFGASSAHLSEEDFAMTQGKLISYGTDPFYAKSYAEYYVTRNVLWEQMVQRPLDQIMTDRTVLPKDVFKRSEFYSDWLQPQDGEEILISCVWQQPERASTITLWRPERLGAWESKHMEAIAALTPHLRRALQTNRYVGDVQVANELAGDVLHRLDHGVVLIGGQQQVLFANRAAESLFARGAGLDVEQRRLMASRAADNAVLERLIADAITNGAGGSMVIAREERPSLIVLVTPLAAKNGAFGNGRASAVVFIKDLERTSNPSLSIFARHFGLTRAQIALAQEMIKADGVASAAGRLGISYATARTHLVQIFQKTETSRQAELVRLMLSWDEASCFSQDAKG